MKSNNKKKKINVVSIIILIVLVSLIVGIGFGFKSQIESWLYVNHIVNSEIIDEDGLSVHFIDVGQGDSTAIEFPDGKTMLVDAGPKSSSENLLTYLNDVFFKNKTPEFDYVLLTHSDEDHCGGMPVIFENFQINKVFRPNIYSSRYSEEVFPVSGKYTTCTTVIYEQTLNAFYNEPNCVVNFTNLDTLNVVDKISGVSNGLTYSIDFYSPNKDYYNNVNDYSPIMVLNYNNKSIMLTGDASNAVENDLVENIALPNVDVLKVGHHGSASSTSESFLSYVFPETAIISCGKDNKYGHPTQQVLNRLSYINAEIFRTDLNGSIIANVLSTESKIIYVVNVTNNKMYIHIEYIICGLVIVSVYFCFGVKYKKIKTK